MDDIDEILQMTFSKAFAFSWKKGSEHLYSGFRLFEFVLTDPVDDKSASVYCDGA